MKKQVVPFTHVPDSIYTRVKDENLKVKIKCTLQIITKQKYPKTLKERSLNVLGYFYAQNF